MGTVISPFFTNTDAFADLTSHDAYVAGTPHATYQRLRRDAPVSWIDERDGAGFWAVMKYRDIVDVSRLFETFTSRQGIRLEEMAPEETEARRTLMEMDPPEHTRLRRTVSKVFTRRIVEMNAQESDHSAEQLSNWRYRKHVAIADRGQRSNSPPKC